ncbi:DUF6514 family protein [Clostridium chauvoei]|uniref:Uncharacterized protein n=2 Tax=Clostridium chauvoei TaxID=46867 RepID=A0A1U6JR80_9CLOT|nr:DUF6514 family protein [Clostridium chauvoei]ATD54057.1 hypothetical protein BTM20_01915 [Clostridium chauvoei]ATD58491.1 hypothetical protein BTM21_12535 [Clostridium chauvoei]MBX7281312.1 hypothetical protein [Clostridium chauvoei]MBX7283782.1 hypothetical protein [Clostridium chauvoei]MBX7286401.1 hypothetical protein [Clostridium chauvoei]
MNIVDSLLSVRTEDNREHKYFYRLFSSSFRGNQAFGIEVERQVVEDGQVINIERDDISLISNDKQKVSKLLDLLYKNQVSPIHLVDVLGEYVDEYVYDFDRVLELQGVI